MATQLIHRVTGTLANPDDIRQAMARLRGAAETTGVPGGGNFLRINRDNGALTFGQNDTPLPRDRRRYVVPLQGFLHGYTVSKGGKPVERHLVPMLSQPDRPMPKEPYVPYPQDGPRDTTEIALASIDEPGFSLIFTSWSVSHSNRLRRLIEEVLAHGDSDEAVAGFVHPVIELKTDSYHSPKKGGKVHHFDFEILDWLHVDGQTLLSQNDGKEPVVAAGGADGGDDASWDDDDDLTEDEKDLLKA